MATLPSSSFSQSGRRCVESSAPTEDLAVDVDHDWRQHQIMVDSGRYARRLNPATGRPNAVVAAAQFRPAGKVSHSSARTDHRVRAGGRRVCRQRARNGRDCAVPE